ncbi:hypothetical protein NA57DRAFT_71020 [Rhizodiscina lignyota]|uniref:SH3 domain-containing protein n=1 Tax=Rhizodiscina lignyota TaxID=1504668 RepID=A0A9P4MBX1_9PEZI|nr:hypothetical protein NA57DRAFT_71020 [Rhizodiscina lignyota]
MTRPQIIRADTLDLQATSSPTAQDHSRQPTHPSPLGIGPAAPHQAAELHHVQEERASEEEQLRQAWNDSAREEPPSEDEDEVQETASGDESYQQRDEQAVQQNGGQAGQGEDQEMADAESSDDMDDDMMDKISSSPSIDDGGYSSYPTRSSSRQYQHQLHELPGLSSPRSSTPVQTQRRGFTPSPTSGMESSPFLSTPQHLPLGCPPQRNVSLETADSGGSSPFTTPPAHYPLILQPEFQFTTPEGHHRYGEYMEHNNLWVQVYDDEGYEDESRDQLSPLPSDRLSVPQTLERDTSVSSLNEEALGRLLLPADDPLLSADVIEPDSPENNPMYTPHALTHDFPADDDDGWETTSESSSFNSADYKDDDTDGFPKLSSLNKQQSGESGRFIDSGWGGECLRETEDIDFEFVYALHTFVATVEGQANATKGDTMVLLDDSNSYWWLVRIVKDSSIGYLPAEHIETPTERLARLNKHRNIDLSATMLGDTAEKSKNPLKKAMRRRNARTVQFNPQPTYRDASDYEYSSDEDDMEENGIMHGGEVQVQEQSAVIENAEDDATLAESASNASKEDLNSESDFGGRTDEVESRRGGADQPRPSEDSLIDKQFGPGKSRNGTVRNTDSFFRDETVETRKITLTPNILRDDSSSATTLRTSEGRERGSSFDSIDKNLLKSESPKDDRKRKEKKGMFSGLFKKKDKRVRGDSDVDTEKMSGEFSPKLSEDSSPMSPTTGSFPTNALQPQRTGSRGKLQKANPKADSASAQAQAQQRASDQPSPEKQPSPQPEPAPAESTTANAAAPQPTMRMVQSDEDMQPEKPQSLRIKTQDAHERGKLSNLTNMLRPSPESEGAPRREKVKKAKQRVELDDFDSSPDEVERPGDPFADINATEIRASSTQGQVQGQNQAQLQEPTERLSESPVQVSPVGATNSLDTLDSNQTPDLVRDNSSAEDHGPSPASDNDFEDVGAEARQMAQPQQQLSQAPQQGPNIRSEETMRPFSPNSSAAPAPLHIAKPPSLRQQPYPRSASAEPQIVPPPPTRAAPIPGVFQDMSKPTSPQLQYAPRPGTSHGPGGRSITPTSALRQQMSAPALNTNFVQAQQQQSPPPLSSPTTSSGSSATPTATTPKTPPTQPVQQPSRTPSTGSSLPAWSDAALRAYMDDTSHVKNLLLVVNDTSGMVRLGPEDEEVKSMFSKEREQLKSMEKELDGLLEGWLERKRGSKGIKGQGLRL